MADKHPSHPHKNDGLSVRAKRLKAMVALLEEKGIVTREEIKREIEAAEARTPADGARVVARAWVDPAYKARLLANPRAALAELGYSKMPIVSNSPDSDQESRLAVMENKEKTHHVVVCTLCSCYPQELLGRPPDWYKSLAYRSRVVRDPRGVLREFGLEVADDVEVRVLDSTADLRFLVLPQRPPGTEGMSEQDLAALVTRDSMIGTGLPRSPGAVSSS